MNVLPAGDAASASTNTHLIVGNTEDYHAVAVAWALRTMGERVLVWDGIGRTDADSVSIAVAPTKQAFRLGRDEIRSLKSAWFRRPVPFKPLVGVAQRDRKFSVNELQAAHLSICAHATDAAAFVVDSRPDNRWYSKAWQLRAAMQAGFTVPPTLISNDYRLIREFIAEHSPIMVKFFTQHYWTDFSNLRIHDVEPQVLTRETELSEASVRLCPAIYQCLVRKAYEIRVTVIGESIFAARISSKNGPAYLDWRPMCGKPDFVMTAMELDASVRDSVRRLLDLLQLRYACIDLAVSNDGAVNFFEINTGGQFLFVDDYVPEFNLLGAFAAMLGAGSSRYSAPSRDEISVQRFETTPDFRRLSAPSSLRSSERFSTEI